MKSVLLALILLLIPIAPIAAQDGNLTDGCITDFDATVDYFPQKAEVIDAGNLTVSYHGHYKLVRVGNAFDGAPAFDYVLVQCGAPAPPAEDFADNAQFIEVPAGRLIALSTTQLPALSLLGVIDHLVAVDSGFYISTPEVVEAIATGEIAEVGFGAQVNIELALELAPDLVLSYGFNPDTDAHPILLEAGIFTALDASWRENSPLGRAEWLKLPALFYNQEARADEIYAGIRTEYQALRELAASIPDEEQPNVLLNSFLSYADAWYSPGADTYVGQLIHDAGADLALPSDDPAGSQPYSFEAAYAEGWEADIWLLETFGVQTAADLLALDSRFADFAAFQSGAIWNNNRDENPNGGNNYYEWGVVSPHLVLADLLAIFHPQLLPEHEFSYYQRLSAA
ncbi:MAG: ABC transporter substrate-binding protein [Chloroflexi bacterium]|nr:ABC transporter substrate-binding protein [Chloroflexota bacterium]MCY3581217.1 ABC transporter substrate-binding protein [Chloroflexota bacterium]MCY3715068.1 ABC transporter substrate-binding protein [Chloroflexota bacterium]MDE2652099.1 ABC transporter substrate-binding protein [Chloroflexota bacterium]